MIIKIIIKSDKNNLFELHCVRSFRLYKNSPEALKHLNKERSYEEETPAGLPQNQLL